MVEGLLSTGPTPSNFTKDELIRQLSDRQAPPLCNFFLACTFCYDTRHATHERLQALCQNFRSLALMVWKL